jgi:hypothetical protein
MGRERAAAGGSGSRRNRSKSPCYKCGNENKSRFLTPRYPCPEPPHAPFSGPAHSPDQKATQPSSVDSRAPRNPPRSHPLTWRFDSRSVLSVSSVVITFFAPARSASRSDAGRASQCNPRRSRTFARIHPSQDWPHVFLLSCLPYSCSSRLRGFAASRETSFVCNSARVPKLSKFAPRELSRSSYPQIFLPTNLLT